MKRIKNYSITALVLAAALFMACLNSCKKNDGYVKEVSTDMSKPAVVTNVKVKNFNGGAYITYDLPNSDNLLYVQAEYRINDKTTRQTKSSYCKHLSRFSIYSFIYIRPCCNLCFLRPFNRA